MTGDHTEGVSASTVTPPRHAGGVNDLEDYRSEQLMFIARAIATRGLAVFSVGSGECSVPGCKCEPEPMPWSYTVGLVERRHPEVMTFGLPPPAAVAILNWVHDRDVAGARIEPGVIERFNGVPIKLLPVPTERVTSDDDPMGQWFHHYGIGRPTIEPPPVLQLLWADRDGFLPGEAGCARAIDELQPRLHEQSRGGSRNLTVIRGERVSRVRRGRSRR
jgi:hypothetical protein